VNHRKVRDILAESRRDRLSRRRFRIRCAHGKIDAIGRDANIGRVTGVAITAAATCRKQGDQKDACYAAHTE
jgi:hypothetical protein